MFLYLSLLILINFTFQQDVLLQSKFGWIRGLRQFDNVDSFHGLRYANQPDRLVKSKVINRWEGIVNATDYGPKCIKARRPEHPDRYSEDCLLMNIFTPADRDKNSSKLPVAVFIYGGGFEKGSVDEKQANGFMTRFVKRGIVVVTFQYRVGALGFLTLGCNSTVLQCNLGLWDHYTAFQFINQTIESFGGNPKNMTLWGHSAGSVAVSIHSHSPLTSKFFINYIELSGSSFTLGSDNRDNYPLSVEIIRDLNCNLTNIVTCIKDKTLDELYTAQVGRHVWPAFGDEIMPKHPVFLSNETKGQNLFTGLQTLEALYFTYLDSDPAEFKNVDRDTVIEYINSSFARYYGLDSVTAFADLVEYFIPPGQTSDNDYVYYMRQKTKIQSNAMFDIAVLREIIQKLEFSPNIYVYHFEHFSKNQFAKDFPLKSSYHCNEFPFVWGTYEDVEFELDEDDHIVGRFMVEALVQFIITGNPSTNNFSWPVTNNDLRHVRITPNVTIQYDLFKDDFTFWDKMVRIFNFDAITGLKYNKPTPSSSNNLNNKYIILITIIISLTSIKSFY